MARDNRDHRKQTVQPIRELCELCCVLHRLSYKDETMFFSSVMNVISGKSKGDRGEGLNVNMLKTTHHASKSTTKGPEIRPVD